jgi:hypothetical protein
MNERGAGEGGRCGEAPRVEAKAVWVGRNSALGQQPTPALNLVFLLAPFGQARALSDRRMLERDEAAWPRLEKDAMARRTPSMEIDSDIRAVQGVVERSVWSRWNDVVHRVGEAGKRREHGGSRENDAMV